MIKRSTTQNFTHILMERSRSAALLRKILKMSLKSNLMRIVTLSPTALEE